MSKTAATAATAGTAGRQGRWPARAISLVISAVLPFCLLCRAAGAQDPAPRPVDPRPWFVDVSHYGKWLALAGAAGLTAVAIMRNQDADQVYDGLARLCRTGGDTCVLNPEGTYINPDAEELYQETLRLDSQARKWMLGGQVALVATGTMFVIDLVAGTRRPRNIPYSRLEYFADGRRVGLRLRL